MVRKNSGNNRNKETFKDAVRGWAARLKVTPSQVRVQKMRKKWASCSVNNRICFSEDLLKEHLDFQEYVIVHELLHLRVPNHGKLFRSLISLYLPNWEEIAEQSKRDL